MMERITSIEIGSLLLADGTRLPESVLLESTPCVPGWKLINNLNLQGFMELISQARWYFLFIATELETTVYGWNQEVALRKAVKRLTSQSKAAKFNCVEIKQVEVNRFLGVPFVRVIARSRQVQEQGILAPGRARISYASE